MVLRSISKELKLLWGEIFLPPGLSQNRFLLRIWTSFLELPVQSVWLFYREMEDLRINGIPIHP